MDRQQENLLTRPGEAPFGAFAPSRGEERARRLAHRLPQSWLGRRLASFLLGPAGGRSGRAFDVEIFSGQKARLHPADNICEKRVYLTPQLWDATERAHLAAAIEAHRETAFYFCDVGANAGLYTLFARSIAARRGTQLRAICVEPDPVMGARLAFNLKASGAAGETAFFAAAASAREEPLRFAPDPRSRGLGRLAETGDLLVAGRPLLDMAIEAGAPRLDALKIDIEGAEKEVLSAFFRDAPPALRPRLAILEIAHETGPEGASALLRALGYEERARTKRNLVLELPAAPAQSAGQA